MEKLTTKYLGLTLRSPLIVSSSRLTSTLGHLKEAEDSGAGAVVLKSLFEEQIMLKAEQTNEQAYIPEGGNFLTEHIHEKDLSDYLSCSKCSIHRISCYFSKKIFS